MEVDICRRTTGWQGYVVFCIAAWLLAGCLTPALAGPGDLDMRFGDQGRLVVAPATPTAPALRQPDGKILIAEGGSDLRVRRYLPNGTTDSQFGQGGTIGVPNTLELVPVAAAIQPDGKLLIAGYRVEDNGFGGSVLFPSFLIRLDPARGGSLDPSFGKDGVVQTSDNSAFQQLLLLRSGDVIVARNTSGPMWDVTRFDRFDSSGRLVTSTPSDLVGPVELVALDDDSALVVDPYYRLRLQRDGFDRNFSLLPEFGVEGVAVDRQGRILTCYRGTITRFTASGQPDPTFGSGSSVSYESIAGVPVDSCRGLVADVDLAGRILVIGSDNAGAGNELRTFVFRLQNNGSLDATVGGPSGPPVLRGAARPAERWQLLWVQATPGGDARIGWRVYGQAPMRERIVVDAIDLVGDTSASAVGIASYEPRALERAGFFELSVLRSGASQGAASVRYDVLPGTAGAADVELASGTLNWAAGDTSRRTLRIALNNDSLTEGEETFSVRLRDGVGVTVRNEPVNVTLVDDEALRALRFNKDTVRWVPDSEPKDWPKLELQRPLATPGPVTAYFHYSNGVYSCCAQGVQWQADVVTPQNVFLWRELAGLDSFAIYVIDDEWQEAGPSLKVNPLPTSTPPTIVPPPPSSGGGSAGGGGGGGGAFGLLDLLLIGLVAVVMLRTEFSRAAAASRLGPRLRATHPSDKMAA